ncbi:MAG: helix-turn-helix domain-containing protein [Alphaproteobacteria bacterium]|nr:helix-turn-helix domain-containing protein [Alphaproteobacteria bacterium]
MKKDKPEEIKVETPANVVETVEQAPVKEEKKEKAPKITKIGAMLKEMRQQKGLKLVDVSKRLCIRKCYLEAIEDSNYKEIPAFPYGIGFIRSYAAFLGLNGENIVELYKEETTASKTKNMNVLEPQSEATMPSIQHILISLLAIVLIYAAWFFYNQSSEETSEATEYSEEASDNYDDVVVVEDFKNDNATADQPETVEVISTNEQITVSNDVYTGDIKEIAQPSTTEANPVTPSIQTEVVTDEETTEFVKQEIPTVGVYLEILKTTWVEVKDNDKLYLSKVLQPGELYRVPDGAGKILSVGKYDGVNVYINGVLTNVVRPQKKMNIYLDKFLNPEL